MKYLFYFFALSLFNHAYLISSTLYKILSKKKEAKTKKRKAQYTTMSWIEEQEKKMFKMHTHVDTCFRDITHMKQWTNHD
jgi:hypothetical protein